MCVRPELRPNCLSAELSRIYGFAAFLNCAAQVAGAICFPRVLIAESDSDKWRRACRVNGKRHIFHRHQEASTQRAYQHKTSLGGERTISFSCFLFFVSAFQRKAELFRTLKITMDRNVMRRVAGARVDNFMQENEREKNKNRQPQTRLISVGNSWSRFNGFSSASRFGGRFAVPLILLHSINSPRLRWWNLAQRHH